MYISLLQQINFLMEFSSFVSVSDLVEDRLNEIFGSKLDDFLISLEKSKAVISGSFLVQAILNGLAVFGGQNSLRGEHGGMGFRSGDILGIKELVEIDRGVYLLHDFGRSTGKAPAPNR